MKRHLLGISLFFTLLSTSVFGQQNVSDQSFSSNCMNTGTVSWDTPNNTHTILVFAKAGSAITVGAPSDEISTYTSANSNFSSATTSYQHDASAKLVYKNNDANNANDVNLNLTGLSPGVTYHFLIFNAEVKAGADDYSTGVTFNGPTPSGNATGFATTNQGYLTWTNPATCFDEILIVSKATATTTGTPTGDGTAYSTNLDFASASVFDGTTKVLYKGTSSGQQIANLAVGTQYYFKIYSRIGTTWSAGVEINTTITAPAAATGGSLSTGCISNATLSWNNPGALNTIVVFAKDGSAISSTTPTSDISAYTANSAFGSGTAYQHDAAAFCVYKGASNSVAISNLAANKTYHFLVFNATSTYYSTAITPSGSTPASLANATTFADAVGDSELNLSWVNPTDCFDEVVIVAKSGGAVSVTPTGDASAYNAGGNAFAAGTNLGGNEYVVYKGTGTTTTITSLTNGTTYHFKIFTRRGTVWSSGAVTDGAPADATPPTITTLVPADNASNVASQPTLSVTFNEAIQKTATPVLDNGDRIRIRLVSDNSAIYTIDKTDPAISVSGSTVTITLPGALALNTQYYVSFGSDVVEDVIGNDFAGITNTTDWSFTTNAGASVTAPTAGACINTYVGIGNIVIAETTFNNFNGTNSGSRTLKLNFDTPGFVFQTGAAAQSAVSATAAGDITGITLTSLTFSTATFTINFDASANDEIETITISGLKVSTDGSSPTGHIRREGTSTLTIEGISSNPNYNFATINGGSPPAAPTAGAPLFSTGNGTYCAGPSALTGITANVVGANIKWYSDATLTTLKGTGNSINLAGGGGTLDINPASAGSYTFYATQAAGCESAAFIVTVLVAPVPVADAGVDLTAGTAVCAASSLTLGGSPTLSNPSVPGAYTYTWNSAAPGFVNPGNTPNPVITVPSPGAQTSYNYDVTIEDANGCQATDTKTVFVKADFTATLTSPPNTSLSYQNNPVVLTASIPGGTFTGPGVINTGGTNPFSFDPEIVYSTGTGGTQSFDINYTVTSNGCTKVFSPIATFQVYSSTAPFTNFPSQFCSNEFPISKYNPNVSSTFSPIIITPSMDTQVQNYVTSYNSGTTYDIKFTGHIRNYYQGAYGGTISGNSSIQQTLGSYMPNATTYPIYGFITDQQYNNCPSCNYGYAGIYVEFQTIDHVVTVFGPSYGITLGVSFDNGYVFYEPGVRSGFYYTGQYVQLNQIPPVSLNGIPNGANICKAQVDGITGYSYPLNGTYSAGFFEASKNGGTTFDQDALSGGAITNQLPNNGTATFNSKYAWDWISAHVNSVPWNSGTNYAANANVAYAGKYYRAILASNNLQPDVSPAYWQENTLAMYIRYAYDPGSKASNNTTPCYSYSTIVVYLHDNPTVDFAVAVPANNTIFCNDDVPVTITATKTTGMTYSGSGVTTLVSGVSGRFTPSVANSAGLAQVNSSVTAVHTDVYGCQADQTRTFLVNPKVTAQLTVPRLTYCNEDVPVTLTGNLEVFTPGTPSGSFAITYRNTSNTPTTVPIMPPGSTYNFDPKTLYNNTYGSVNGSTQNIDIAYTEKLTTGIVECINTTTTTLSIKAPIVLDIAGLSGNPIYCSNDPNNPNSNNFVTFQGNVPGAGIFSLDDDSDFSSINGTVNATISNSSGSGTIHLGNAFSSTTNGTPTIKQIYTQYAYTGPGCTGAATVVKDLRVSSPPTVSFDFGTTPANNQIFCFDGVEINLKATQSAGATSILSGFGVIDDGTGSGNATFKPSNAFNASVAAGNPINSNQTIAIKVAATDINGCKSVNNVTNNISYTINKVPDASFTINGNPAGSSLDLCYNAAAVSLVGNLSKAWYSVVFKGTTNPYTENFGSIGAPQNSLSFNPKTNFDKSVTLGANALNTIQYDVIYSVADGNNCSNTLAPVTFSVAPQLQVDFAGLNDGDIFCSNAGAKPITFSPFPASDKRTFTINGQNQGLSSGTFNFETIYTKDGGSFVLNYTVLSGANCINPVTKTITVLPSPKAIFSPVPHCKEDVISFSADGSQNTAPLTTTYTWNFQDQNPSQLTGQNVNYQWISEGIYNVALNAAYEVNNGLVCQETSTNQQTIGGIPQANFTVSSLCEGDVTQFRATASSPAIFDYEWKFDDGETIGFGQGGVVVNDTNTPNTSGTFREPNHRFQYKTTPYKVTLTGRTPPASGGCTSTITKDVSILKFLTRAPSNIYRMSSENGGDGYFVLEDKNGNSKWAYSLSTPDGSAGKQEMAWNNNSGYLPNDVSFLNSPCFNISAYDRPLFAIRYWTDTKVQSDGTVTQFSTDGGQTWTTMGGFIGTVSTGLNWYDVQGVSGKPGEQAFNTASVAWSRRNDTDWSDGRHSLDIINPGQRSKVRFRIAFGSDLSNNQDNLKGFAFSEVKIDERNRLVLAENFTNNTISSASKNNQDFVTFKNNTNELVKLQYHIGLPTSDDINKQNPADANARAGFYGLTNSNALVPKGYLDGVISNGNFINAGAATWVDTEFSLRSLVPSPIELALTTLPTDNDKFAIRATLKAISPVTKGKLTLFIAVIEKSVGSDGFVVRKLLPSGSGMNVTLPIAIGQQLNFTPEPWEVKNINSISQLAVVAFVQDTDTKEVLQSAYLANPANLPTIITGLEDVMFGKAISLYPNPADQELTIQLPQAINKSMPVQLTDQLGKIVYTSSFKAGEKSKTINTRDLAAGLYILQLDAEGKTARAKVIVVHQQ